MKPTDTKTSSPAVNCSHWFIASHQKKSGPFPWQRLVSMAARGELAPDVMLFKEGSKRWVRAGTLSALFGTPVVLAPAVSIAATRPLRTMPASYLPEDVSADTFLDEVETLTEPRTFPTYVANLDDVDERIDPALTESSEEADAVAVQTKDADEATATAPSLQPAAVELEADREEEPTAPPAFATASLAFESFLKRIGGIAEPETSQEPQRTDTHTDEAPTTPTKLPDIMPSPKWSPADVMAAVRDMEPEPAVAPRRHWFEPPDADDAPSTSAAPAPAEPEVQQPLIAASEEPVKRHRIPWLMEAVTAAAVSLILGTSIVLGFFASEWTQAPELKIESREETKEPVLQLPANGEPTTQASGAKQD